MRRVAEFYLRIKIRPSINLPKTSGIREEWQLKSRAQEYINFHEKLKYKYTHDKTQNTLLLHWILRRTCVLHVILFVTPFSFHILVEGAARDGLR